MKQWLKICIAAFLVFLLWRNVDWVAVGRTLAGVSFGSLGAYIILQLLGNFISAKKWQYLARTQGFYLPLSGSFFAYLTGAFLNNFFPSTIGGDAYRVLWMSQSGKRFQAFSVVLLDRMSGLLALFLAVGVGLLFFPWRIISVHPWLISLSACVAGLSLLTCAAFFWLRGMYAYVLRLLGRWARLARIRVGMERLQGLAHTQLFRRALGWSALFLLIGIGFSNLALWLGLDPSLNPQFFFACLFLATLIANIPISINNIGVKEWAYVFIFGLIGVKPEVAVTAAIISRLLQMFISCIALPWYVMERRRTSPVLGSEQLPYSRTL